MPSETELKTISLISAKYKEFEMLLKSTDFCMAAATAGYTDFMFVKNWRINHSTKEMQLADSQQFEKSYDAMVSTLASYKDGNHPFKILEVVVQAQCPYITQALINFLQKNDSFNINAPLNKRGETLKDIADAHKNPAVFLEEILISAGAKNAPKGEPASIVTQQNKEDIELLSIRAQQMLRFLNKTSTQVTSILYSTMQRHTEALSSLTSMADPEKIYATPYQTVKNDYEEVLFAIVSHHNPMAILRLVVINPGNIPDVKRTEAYEKNYFAVDLIHYFVRLRDINLNVTLSSGRTLLDLAHDYQKEQGGRADIVDALSAVGAETEVSLGAGRVQHTVQVSDDNENTNDRIQVRTEGAQKMTREPDDIAHKISNVQKEKPVVKQSPKKWQFIIDQCNRLFDSFFDRNSYIPIKDDAFYAMTYPSLIGIFLTRFLLLPMSSTVYVFSRLALIVLNPQAYRHNSAKAGLMLGATLMAAGTVIGLAMGTSLFSAQAMMSIAGSVGGGAAVVGLVGMVAFATLLHVAKTIAQQINKREVVDGNLTVYVTAPKHHIHDSSSAHLLAEGLAPVEKYHKTFLVDYYARSKEPPLFFESNRARAAKCVLNAFEKVAQAKKANTFNQDTMNDLNAELEHAVRNTRGTSATIWETKEALKGATVVDGKVILKL